MIKQSPNWMRDHIQQIWKSSVKKLMTRLECKIIDEKRFSSSVATTQTGTQKTSSSVRFCYRLTLVAFPKYLQFYTNTVLSHATSCHHSAHYIPKKQGQYHDCLCHCPLRVQVIGIRSIIDYVGLTDHCLSWGSVSTAGNSSMSGNNRNCRYIYVFPKHFSTLIHVSQRQRDVNSLPRYHVAVNLDISPINTMLSGRHTLGPYVS